jgi:hypothetical protein
MNALDVIDYVEWFNRQYPYTSLGFELELDDMLEILYLVNTKTNKFNASFILCDFKSLDSLKNTIIHYLLRRYIELEKFLHSVQNYIEENIDGQSGSYEEIN